MSVQGNHRPANGWTSNDVGTDAMTCAIVPSFSPNGTVHGAAVQTVTIPRDRIRPGATRRD